MTLGSGAKSFNYALDIALKFDLNELVYFVENDYVHIYGSPAIINEAFELGAHYLTLYLHPDKFMPKNEGGNPEVEKDLGYKTKIYKGRTQLFAVFNSTTMTFVASVKTLIKDLPILRKYTNLGHCPKDYAMFIKLRSKGRLLMCPLSTFSTHGETKYLAPLPGITNEQLVTEWEKYIFINK